MDGVVILNKPSGRTSHDMVAFIRKLFGTKKVGHTGTLDPDAEGVLPICIGKATKAADMLTVSDKAYRAHIVLGMTTDTQDASGEILTEQPVNITKTELENAIQHFIGEIEQIPPMFSAVKIGGKKLYELARRGIEIERKSRKITIYDIKLTAFDEENGTALIDVRCSKGTYIRTLCEDIGAYLGCGAYMNSLVRTQSAGFSEKDSRTPSELEQMKAEGILDLAVIPVDRLFSGYPEVKLNDFLAAKVKNGVRIRLKHLEDGCLYRVYDEQKNFLCISRYAQGELVLEKAFWS